MTIAASPTVLVVEDEIFVRIIAADVLEERGFRVLEAGTAAEALELLNAHAEVAVLFTDINMPGEMDGLQLAAIVAEKRPEVKLVVTSGRQWMSPQDLPDNGKFLPKPYGTEQLVQLVAAL